MNPWLYLAGAILTEVCGTVSMKLSNGFEHTLYSILVYAFYAVSFYLLALALKSIAVGTAYAVWSGVGTALIAGIGVLFFNESINAVKIVSLGAIIAGVVGLHLATA